MKSTITLEVKKGKKEYEGKMIDCFCFYREEEYVGMGFVVVPILDTELRCLARDILTEGIKGVTVKIKTYKELPLDVQNRIYQEFMYTELFKEIVFLT